MDVSPTGFPSQVFWVLTFPGQIPGPEVLRVGRQALAPLGEVREVHGWEDASLLCAAVLGAGFCARPQCVSLQHVSTLSFDLCCEEQFI